LHGSCASACPAWRHGRDFPYFPMVHQSPPAPPHIRYEWPEKNLSQNHFGD
jgi:hypothetical protein